MKSIFNIKIMVALLITLASCTSQFDSINTDPNRPTKATPELLLTPILRTLVQGQYNFNNGAGLARHLARTNYNEIEQYSFNTNDGYWKTMYLQLNNINDLIKISDRDNRPSSKAIGYILKSFVASQLTDLWNEVPYFNASTGTNDITPAYDSQQSIYLNKGGIIDLLSEAETLLAGNSDILPSDIVYKGDRTKWRKLANSLRLRYLMRISNQIAATTETDIKREIGTLISNHPLMDNNGDNALLKYTAGSPNKNPVFDMREGEFEYIRMSKELETMFNAYNDPRREIWFRATANSEANATPVYKGIPVGCSSTTLEEMNYSSSDVSLLGNYFRSTPDGCSAIFMACSEVKFLQAEAIVRGFASGDAKICYEEGIRAAITYYGIQVPDGYLTQPEVAYNASKALTQIMNQKWLSLFFVGYEAWFDYLRTGLPEKEALLDNRNPTAPGQIPSRFYYPEDEQALNKENYTIAVQNQGGKDDINTKLWWEKKQ